MSKGNVSKIDNLGRVVIPKSIRKALNIEHNDEISMYVDGESLIIKKGYRIAQMMLTPIIKIELEETNDLPETIRGKGLFGSTGKWILN